MMNSGRDLELFAHALYADPHKLGVREDELLDLNVYLGRLKIPQHPVGNMRGQCLNELPLAMASPFNQITGQAIVIDGMI